MKEREEEKESAKVKRAGYFSRMPGSSIFYPDRLTTLPTLATYLTLHVLVEIISAVGLIIHRSQITKGIRIPTPNLTDIRYLISLFIIYVLFITLVQTELRSLDIHTLPLHPCQLSIIAD